MGHVFETLCIILYTTAHNSNNRNRIQRQQQRRSLSCHVLLTILYVYTKTISSVRTKTVGFTIHNYNISCSNIVHERSIMIQPH